MQLHVLAGSYTCKYYIPVEAETTIANNASMDCQMV